MKTMIVGGGRRSADHFARPGLGGHFRRRASLPSPVDVLQHHDRVVHDDAEPHGEPHEGEQVQRNPVDQLSG
jgi:hypothetical protein